MPRYYAYVGTYTHEKSVGIYVYQVDPDNGVLTQQSVAKISNPSNLIMSHTKDVLYSIHDEGVAAYKIKEDGNLEFINAEWIGGMRGCHISTDSKDRMLFVSGYHDGRVSMMKLNADGSIRGIADGVFHQGIGKSVAEKRLEPHVTCVVTTPDDKYLCAVDTGLHQIKVYEINYITGKLRLADIVRCTMDSGPRRMRFSKDGRFMYVVTEHSNEILVYSYEVINGNPEFELVQAAPLLTGKDDEISSGTNIKANSDASYVFASVDGLNAICMYKRDAETGKLEYISNTCVSGDYPKSFAVLPGDKFFVSLNHDTDELRTFRIDYEHGHSLMCNPPIPIQKPNCIQIRRFDD